MPTWIFHLYPTTQLLIHTVYQLVYDYPVLYMYALGPRLQASSLVLILTYHFADAPVLFADSNVGGLTVNFEECIVLVAAA